VIWNGTAEVRQSMYNNLGTGCFTGSEPSLEKPTRAAMQCRNEKRLCGS
jgi:hypothetical protein